MKRLALFAVLFLSIAATARPDDLNGIFTYQIGSGTFSTITAPNGQITALGVDNAGAVLLANGNGPDVLYDPSANVATPIALQGSQPGSTNFAVALAGNGDVLGTNIFETRDYFIQHLNGSTALINLPPIDSFPTGINSNGIVAGVADDESSGFLFNSHTGAVTTAFSGPAFAANVISINDRGQLIYSINGTQFFIYNPDGTSIPLTLPSGCHPAGMNDLDQIVGNCVPSQAGNFDGFLLSGGKFSTLNFSNSDQNNTIVTGINDNGEIVGQYEDVPEPSTLCLLGAGLLAFCYFKKFV